MCGIAGMFRFDGRAVDECALRRMTDALAHRGPDGQGIYLADGIGLGHRRLSIIDLSDAAAQPLPNEDGTVWLTYNGEIYNYAEIRNQLVARGHTFRSHTDSEVIVHAYEEWGTRCLSHFNGMFAFALWDARAGSLWLVRDRLGVKPLFYALSPQGIHFGSEIKSILADSEVPKHVDYEALGCYLAFNYIPAPLTLLREVRQVEPGHYLLVERSGKADDVEYWDIPYKENEPARPDGDYIEEMSALLSDSVRARLVSDVPLGVFLSGGVDSSGVAYWMSRHQRSPVQSFSIGFDVDTFDETPYAREVAASIEARHHEQMVSADLADLLPKIVYHAEEPTADSSMIAVYHLAALARQHVTVVLSGDGADDLLGGYETHQAYYLHHWYRRIPGPIRRRLLAPLINALPPSERKVSLTEKLQRFVAAAELPSDDAHASWRIIFDREARQRLLAPVGEVMGQTADPLVQYRRSFARSTARHPLNRLLYVDTRLYLPADMLVKIDRMTMAHGLEAREPYLDYRLVEFAARVPPRLKLRHWTTKKYILKAALAGRVPASVLRRKKQGFNVPKARWIREELKPYVRDRLSPTRVRAFGVFDAATVNTMVDRHLSGHADHSHQIWSLLVLTSWLEQFGVSL